MAGSDGKRVRVGGGRRGMSFMGTLITILIVAGLASIYLFVPPYFNAWKFGGMLRSIAMKAENLPDENAIREYAVIELGKQDYVFKPEQLTVTREGGMITIEGDYLQVVEIPFTEYRFEIFFHKSGTSEPPLK